MENLIKLAETEPENPRRHRWPKWLRISLRTLLIVLVIILLIPVALYIPPIQTAVKNIACSVVKKQTGMDVGIESFRLKFPLDISLQGVTVVEATGDTMVKAREAIADVKLLPLLKLDVKLKKLLLKDGYYRMVSPDSSMIMKINAGLLTVGPGSSMNIADSRLLIDDALLENGHVSLVMDVWKQKPTPEDTTAAPFYIKADRLRLKNFTFGMSMLPTIDTLSLTARDLEVRGGIIDLAENAVSMASVKGTTGNATYITPTEEYIKTHPLPVDTAKTTSPPMTIKGDSIRLSDFNVLYATKGAVPAAGFDPAYINVSNLNLGIAGFFNKATTVVLPIAELSGRERSGLTITSGQGTIGVNEQGISIEHLKVTTPYSNIDADADVSFAMMEMKPDGNMRADIKASIGMADINAFMPDLKQYTAMLPNRYPLVAELSARGSLSDITLQNMKLSIRDFMQLEGSGHAVNPMDMKRLRGNVKMHGRLINTSLLDRTLASMGVTVPPMTLDLTAQANGQAYTADLTMRSPAGNVAANGHVSLNAEAYEADIDIDGLDVKRFMPAGDIGDVTAHLSAVGDGFNPTKPGAQTNIHAEISELTYLSHKYGLITADATLDNGMFSIDAQSADPQLDFVLAGTGSISPELYTLNANADIKFADLYALGLTEDTNCGSASLTIKGEANPDRWLYNVDLDARSVDWNMPEQRIYLSEGLKAHFNSTSNSVTLNADAARTQLRFEAAAPLDSLIDRMNRTMTDVMADLNTKDFYVDKLTHTLPAFNLALNASGSGALNQFLSPTGISTDTIFANLSNGQDGLQGRIGTYKLATESVKLDSITLDLKQRDKVLTYLLHLGNRPGTLDDFAQVDLRGYLGNKRASILVNQTNIKGETGYRLGLTAAFADSLVSLHFTPLKAKIAYMPWQLNDDNHVNYYWATRRIDANLTAHSSESSISLQTVPADEPDATALKVGLANIRIQDFLQMSVFAPPMTGSANADMTFVYKGNAITGNGNLGLNDFTYNRTRVGSFGLDFNAGLGMDGNTEAQVNMSIDGRKVLFGSATINNDETASQPMKMGVALAGFPLDIANPFLDGMAKLSGELNGNMRMTGKFDAPLLNGALQFSEAHAFVPMSATDLKIGAQPITVKNNVLAFKKLKILAANENPLIINGSVDASKLNDIKLDMGLEASNIQLIGGANRQKSDIYGKLFMNLNASAVGPLSHFKANADVSVLAGTDVGYTLSEASQAVTEQTADNIVKFVNFSDTTQVAQADSIASSVNMYLRARLNISQGVEATVNLSNNAQDRVELTPSGSLNFTQNYMGDMKMTGQLNLGEGFARYNIPVMGEKRFDFEPNSYLLWNGTLLNPILHIAATDMMKASVKEANNSRLINFLVTLNVNGTLEAPKILFDLSTNDDITVQNELQSMSADQRSNQAMNLLIYNTYTGPGTKASSNLSGNPLYSFLESQLNSWASNNIRGVDLSFGIDQYDKTVDGQSKNTTSYSYQVSKSLFNNRFKIIVGGNYSTDANADENFAQNLVSDISFEYMLRQTNSMSMYLKLFRHTGYESILEGEITETGVGVVLRRKLSNLSRFFRLRRRKRSTVQTTEAADTMTVTHMPMTMPADTLPLKPAEQ